MSDNNTPAVEPTAEELAAMQAALAEVHAGSSSAMPGIAAADASDAPPAAAGPQVTYRHVEAAPAAAPAPVVSKPGDALNRILGRTRISASMWHKINRIVVGHQARVKDADIVIALGTTYNQKWAVPAIKKLLGKTAARAVFVSSGQDTPELMAANQSHATTLTNKLAEQRVLDANQVIDGPIWNTKTGAPANLDQQLAQTRQKLIAAMPDRPALMIEAPKKDKNGKPIIVENRPLPAIVTENASNNTLENFTKVFEIMAGMPMPSFAEKGAMNEFKDALKAFLKANNVRTVHVHAFKGYNRAVSTLTALLRRMEMENDLKVTSSAYSSPSVHVIVASLKAQKAKQSLLPAANHSIADLMPEATRIIMYGLNKADGTPGDVLWGDQHPNVVNVVDMAIKRSSTYKRALGAVAGELDSTREEEKITGIPDMLSIIDKACLKGGTGYVQRRAILTRVCELSGAGLGKGVLNIVPFRKVGTFAINDEQKAAEFVAEYQDKNLEVLMTRLWQEASADIKALHELQASVLAVPAKRLTMKQWAKQQAAMLGDHGRNIADGTGKLLQQGADVTGRAVKGAGELAKKGQELGGKAVEGSKQALDNMGKMNAKRPWWLGGGKKPQAETPPAAE